MVNEKEKLLDKIELELDEEVYNNYYGINTIEKAMDEWARVQSIEFAEWAAKNKYRWLIETKKWTNPNEDLLKTEQLYNLFIDKK